MIWRPQFEDHHVLEEPGKCLTIVLQTGHTKHLPPYCRRCHREFFSNSIVTGSWINGHISINLHLLTNRQQAMTRQENSYLALHQYSRPIAGIDHTLCLSSSRSTFSRPA